MAVFKASLLSLLSQSSRIGHIDDHCRMGGWRRDVAGQAGGGGGPGRICWRSRGGL